MTIFLSAAAALVVLTLLLLLRPWARRRNEGTDSARESNTRIYRDQLQELDRDLAAGTLSAADHERSRAELQRRLLQDVHDASAAEAAPGVAGAADGGMRRTSLLLAVAMPVLAGWLYVGLGTPAALDPQARRAAAPSVSPDDVEKMVATLAARLERQPDDPKGWAMLARSYRVMGRLPQAQAAFERIGRELLDNDPALLMDYATVLATLTQGRLEGKPLQLATRALELDPDNLVALSLTATAAFNRGDFAAAAAGWQRLLALVPAGSEDAQWLEQRLAEVRAAGGTPGGQAAAGGSADQAVAGLPAVGSGRQADTGAPAGAAPVKPPLSASIRGRVSLAPALAASTGPDDTVFVFARAAQGGRMPLAVQRARVADLPLDFELNDSMAMSPQARLSSATEVRIEARVSKGGSATPGPGDLIGLGPVVKPGTSGVAVQIDQIRK